MKKLIAKVKKLPKHVVLITGNPSVITGMKKAEIYYNKIISHMEKLGFKVSTDPGLPGTIPRVDAWAWIAHSMGEDRLQYAPPYIKTLILGPPSDEPQSPDHYVLTDADYRAMNMLEQQWKERKYHFKE